MRNLGASAVVSATQAAFAATGSPVQPPARVTVPCPLYAPIVNWYSRFLDGPRVKALTPQEKGWLAVRNVIDPFNAITILGTSAISVGADSHSAYGPGMGGFGHLVGVSYAEGRHRRILRHLPHPLPSLTRIPTTTASPALPSPTASSTPSPR